MTTKADDLIQSCAPKRDKKKWSTFVATRCTQESPSKCAYPRPEEHPSRQDGRDKGQPGKPNVRARWVAKEYKTHVRPELYASTPPLEAMKVVLSEIATGEREGNVVALVDVRRAYFHAPAPRKVFVELPPEDYQLGDEHMCGLLRYSLYGTRDATQNWEEELASTLSSLKLTRGSACPCAWRGHIKGEDIIATVHGDDITIGGERSAVESLIRMISKKHEIKKQMLGKIRTLRRVAEY